MSVEAAQPMAARGRAGTGPPGRTDIGMQPRPAAVAAAMRRGESLVDEDRSDRARAAVQILVRAPRREVDVPVVEREFDVAGGVGEVPADNGPAA